LCLDRKRGEEGGLRNHHWEVQIFAVAPSLEKRGTSGCRRKSILDPGGVPVRRKGRRAPAPGERGRRGALENAVRFIIRNVLGGEKEEDL